MRIHYRTEKGWLYGENRRAQHCDQDGKSLIVCPYNPTLFCDEPHSSDEVADREVDRLDVGRESSIK